VTFSFNAAAIAEIREAGDYYEQIRPELRVRFAHELARAIRDIGRFPLM